MIQLDNCLQQIISKLVIDLSHSSKLEAFRSSFQKRKIYNQRQKAYIENQKIKLQLGAQYDSQQSDADQDYEEFGSLTKFEMKSLLKDNLIKNKFDQHKLSYIEPPTPQQEPSQIQFLGNQDDENGVKTNKIDKNNLKVITQKKSSNILGKKNFEALDFVIQQLEKLVKQ